MVVMVQLGQKEPLVQQVLQVLKEIKVLLGLRVLLAIKVQQVHKDLQVVLVLRGKKVK